MYFTVNNYLIINKEESIINIDEFYQETIKYISIQESYYIKDKYYNLYILTKRKRHKLSEDIKFINDYKNLFKFIEDRNNLYLKRLRPLVKDLDNINGFPLDEYQSRVVLSEEQNSLVIAGAGAGKSTTIIGKIVYLVKYKNIKPEDILCISFTNDSTINLKNNISKNYHFNLDIYTFHKLALTILKSQKNYQISPDNYLEQVINDFFTYQINDNKILKKALNKIIHKNKELTNLKRTIITFINLFKSHNYDLSYYKEILKKNKYNFNLKEHFYNKYLLLIIINIYLQYEYSLSTNDTIDFNDMINHSINSIKKYGLNKKWQYIIIDEFQDTSLTKLKLIEEIVKVTNAKLLVVGDDFQSIYRFTGCNLSIFLNFKHYFPYTKEFYIINTYRNPQELINVAGNFIMKNKYQIKKHLISFKKLKYPIKIIYNSNNCLGLKKILNYINNLNYQDILVLGRNNNDINNYIDKTFCKEGNIYTYNNIKFKYLTIHKSKGLESSIVILINMHNTITGMPTKMKSENILKYVNNEKEIYPYEEERRLFYVALTRTKNYCFILTNPHKESIFIHEIKKYHQYVETINI